ncbi:MAG: hypothetical protein AAGD14_05155 [Planctomycetota bacterium]
MRILAGLLLLFATPSTWEQQIESWVPDAGERSIKLELWYEHPKRGALFRKDDPLLLPAIRRALENPLGTPAFAERWAREIQSAPFEHLTTHRGGPDLVEYPKSLALEGLPALEEKPRETVLRLAMAAATAAGEVERAYAKLTAEERAFLRAHLPQWLSRTTKEEEADAKAAKEDVTEREVLQKCAQLMQNVDHAAIRFSTRALHREIERAIPILRSQKNRIANRTVIETKFGPVILRGQANQGGLDDALLIIDFGGDDEHKAPKEPVWRPVRVHLDLEGDDIYITQANHMFAGALCGISILVDVEGDDEYRGRDWSLGCALGGQAVLQDKAGDDRYFGGLGTQGAGIFGEGVIIDEGGDDEYQAGLFAQGFGSTFGLGAIYDAAGDDLYIAGRDEEDIWRRVNTWVTFAQGSAFSHRFGHILEEEGQPRRWEMTGQLAGGIGLLVDAAGNDRYSADVFGQGSAYWFSLGLLVDLEGDDRYRATWYGQGVGTHGAVGCVVDVAGHDRYHGRNTSQGCGHDFSAGLLVDRAGNDRYRSMTLSQGAGNALSSIGMLVDEAGDDWYRVENRGWGYAKPEEARPEHSPYGFFLDLGGANTYAGQHAARRKAGLWQFNDRSFGYDRKEKDQ